MKALSPIWHSAVAWVPARPIEPATSWLADNPIVIPVVLIVLAVAIKKGWGKLTERQMMSGLPFAPLGMVARRTWDILMRQDRFPVLFRPAKLAARLQWLTWTRYTKIAAAWTLVWFVAPPTNFLPLSDGLNTRVWLAGLAVPVFAGYTIGKHVQRVVSVRHRTLMQMFEVASAECRYQGGSELNPWGYIQIQDWREPPNCASVYQLTPGTTSVMYPPKFRSEDVNNRQAFERNFSGTVNDVHSWLYTWESSNNRVICEPVPFITDTAEYQFPDDKPWNIFPLGIAAGGKEAFVDVTVFPHMLIAGTTGSGKSVTQRTILLHAIQHPDWRVVLIDPKRVELSGYRTARNVLRIATELEDMTDLIEQVEQEMQARYKKMEEEGVNHFNLLSAPPPALLVMVDEVYTLLSPENVKSEEGKERDALHARCTSLIGTIARLGRAAGVHLVLATQRPDAKVIPGETRALALDTRLPTPTGWVTVGDAQVGTILLDETGRECRVTGTTEVMVDHDCYEVVFSDGTTITADAGHLWPVRARVGAAGKVSVLTTREMAAALETAGGTCHETLDITVWPAVAGEAAVPLPGQSLHPLDGSLRGTRAQRQALLDELVDAWGTVEDGKIMVSPAGRDKLPRIAELARTLGRAAVEEVDTVWWPLLDVPRQIVAVRPVASVPVKCLAVDSPSRLFLAGDGMVATHNSNLDCRIAQGRMDTIASTMVLDSIAATTLPAVKGRAMLRVGNDYQEFQAYFCPEPVLAQLLEMANALASGVLSPADLLGDPTGGGPDGSPGGARARLAERVSTSLAGLRKRATGPLSQWKERRRRAVAQNETRAGRQQRHSYPAGDDVAFDGDAAGPRELTMEEISEFANAPRAERPEPLFAQVELPDPDEVQDLGYGLLVGDVLRAAAREGRPIAASELIAALRAEVSLLDEEIAARAFDDPQPAEAAASPAPEDETDEDFDEDGSGGEPAVYEPETGQEPGEPQEHPAAPESPVEGPEGIQAVPVAEAPKEATEGFQGHSEGYRDTDVQPEAEQAPDVSPGPAPRVGPRRPQRPMRTEADPPMEMP